MCVRVRVRVQVNVPSAPGSGPSPLASSTGQALAMGLGPMALAGMGAMGMMGAAAGMMGGATLPRPGMAIDPVAAAAQAAMVARALGGGECSLFLGAHGACGTACLLPFSSRNRWVSRAKSRFVDHSFALKGEASTSYVFASVCFLNVTPRHPMSTSCPLARHTRPWCWWWQRGAPGLQRAGTCVHRQCVV